MLNLDIKISERWELEREDCGRGLGKELPPGVPPPGVPPPGLPPPVGSPGRRPPGAKAFLSTCVYTPKSLTLKKHDRRDASFSLMPQNEKEKEERQATPGFGRK